MKASNTAGQSARVCAAVAIAAVLLPNAAAKAATARISGDYPSKTIRIVDQYGTGGATDVMARLIGQKLTERFGQAVVVDNRPGVAGNLAADIVAKATPDGHTMLMAVLTDLATGPLLYPQIGVQAPRDFAFVTPVAAGSYVMAVTPALGVKSVGQLVALAKSRPGQIKYGSGGVGSALHLCGELFRTRAGVDLLHVPYKGGAAAVMTATTGGEVDIGFASIAGSMPFVTTGRVVPIAVTSAKRAKAYPNVPTLGESGYPGYDITPWYGLVVPVGTPNALVKALSAEIGKILHLPDVQSTFANLGLEATAATPERFREIMLSDIAMVTKIVKDAGIKPPQ